MNGDGRATPSSRVSRVTMRSKFSSVNLVTASVRPMSVNARTRSMMTGANEEHASSTSAGPRNRAKLVALPSQLGAREIGHGGVPVGGPKGALRGAPASRPGQPIVLA